MQKNMANVTDDELVSFINNGQYEFLQLLINRYMPYIISVASHYKAGGLDTEDFIQEGVTSIFSAVKAYDKTKSSFKTFVTLCINRAMSSALTRATGAAKHIPEGLISPIDDVELADMSSPESILIEKENYFNLERTIKNNLSDFEYQVLCEFLMGKSYTEIAENLSVSTKSIDNALSRVRSKIKK